MRKSRDLELGPFLNSLSVIVPSYQRDYVWGDVQIYDLLKEIDYIFDNKKDKKFLGLFGTYKDIKSKKTFIIDGQQRITTLVILFSVLRKLLSKYSEEKNVQNKIITITNNLIGTGEDFSEYTIIHQEPLNTFFKSYIINEIQTIPVNLEINDCMKKIQKNYNTIYKYYENKNPEDLIKILNIITYKLELTEICFDTQVEAYEYYRDINGSGIPLTQVDLIKHYLVENSKDKKEAVHNWNLLKKEIKSNDMDRYFLYIYNAYFGRYVISGKDLFKNYIKEDPELIIKELVTNISLYKNLDQKKEFFTTINYFNLLSIKQIMPLFFILQRKLKNEKNIKNCLNIALYYYIERSISNKRQNIIQATTDNICETLKNNNLEYSETIDLLKSEYSKLGNVDNNNIKINYKNAFQKRHKTKHRFILTMIENSKLKEMQLITSNKKVNLEHIVPINYNESYEISEEEYDLYIHSLGNMTLLNESANKTIKDSNWNEKKEAYKESNISITKKLSEQESFTKEDIIKRTDALLDEFLKILSSLLEEK